MILIFDFGSQYTQLIARKIRQFNVKSEIVPYDFSPAAARKLLPEGVILSGGPASTYAPGAPKLNTKLLQLGVPVLGICYGMQSLSRKLGEMSGAAPFVNTAARESNFGLKIHFLKVSNPRRRSG